MKLEGNRKKVMDSIINGLNNIQSITSKTKLESRIVKNVIMELYDAQLIRKTEDGIITVRVKPPKNSDETLTIGQDGDENRIKNLARIV